MKKSKGNMKGVLVRQTNRMVKAQRVVNAFGGGAAGLFARKSSKNSDAGMAGKVRERRATLSRSSKGIFANRAFSAILNFQYVKVAIFIYFLFFQKVVILERRGQCSVDREGIICNGIFESAPTFFVGKPRARARCRR